MKTKTDNRKTAALPPGHESPEAILARMIKEAAIKSGKLPVPALLPATKEERVFKRSSGGVDLILRTGKEDPEMMELALNPEDPFTRQAVPARAAVDPIISAAGTIQRFAAGKDGSGPDAVAMALELDMQCAFVRDGNMGRLEAMLVSQAHTLDALFANMAARAALNVGQYPATAELYLKLAMRAQGQCRATVETIGLLKNPLAGSYVKQANLAQGHQQINNSPPPASEPRARGKKAEFELSGAGNELLPDARASALACEADPKMETLAQLNGPEISGGKAARRPEQPQARRANASRAAGAPHVTGAPRSNGKLTNRIAGATSAIGMTAATKQGAKSK